MRDWDIAIVWIVAFIGLLVFWILIHGDPSLLDAIIKRVGGY